MIARWPGRQQYPLCADLQSLYQCLFGSFELRLCLIGGSLGIIGFFRRNRIGGRQRLQPLVGPLGIPALTAAAFTSALALSISSGRNRPPFRRPTFAEPAPAPETRSTSNCKLSLSSDASNWPLVTPLPFFTSIRWICSLTLNAGLTCRMSTLP